MKKVPIHKFHEKHGKLFDFAGFEMPLWYEGVIPEHITVRKHVGLFDISHMGRAIIIGDKSAEFLDYLTTRDPSNLKSLQGQYSTMCNVNGGIIDDIIVYNLEQYYLMVYNAANRVKDFEWLVTNAQAFDVEVRDVSDESVMFAVQGPESLMMMQQLTDKDITGIKRFWVDWVEIAGLKTLCMRSGYTGENGFEIILFDQVDSTLGITLWEYLLEKGNQFQIQPCGLGARDSLRLEAGLCLYGNDLTEDITPFEARLDFVVKLSKNDFIGRKALIKQKEVGLSRIRVGLKMAAAGIPRHGFKLSIGEHEVGCVTSGGYSPILKRGIAMGYVTPNIREVGTSINVDVRGKLLKANIVNMPFYDTDKYGWKRIITS